MIASRPLIGAIALNHAADGIGGVATADALAGFG
jgi:hypothetical protein